MKSNMFNFKNLSFAVILSIVHSLITSEKVFSKEKLVSLEYVRFRDWCLNSKALSSETQEVIVQLLGHTDTFNCDRAEIQLNRLTELKLFGYFDNFKPIASLKNLKKLDIVNQTRNKTDLHPLSSMINLTHLTIRSKV